MADDFQQVINFDFSIDGFVQGNNGSILRFNVLRNKAIVPIDGATVLVAIKHGETLTMKQAVITDGPNGKCEVTLTRSDLIGTGLYFLQPTIIFADDDEFSGDVQRFKVSGKLTGVPPADNGGDSGGIYATKAELEALRQIIQDLQKQVSVLQNGGIPSPTDNTAIVGSAVVGTAQVA